MNNLYYEQKYQLSKNQVPDSSFGQIMRETFGDLFKWNARSTRKTFWTGFITSGIIEMILGMIWCFISFKQLMLNAPSFYPGYYYPHESFSNLFGHLSPAFYVGGIIIFLICLYLFLCQLGLAVRRLHDIDHNGWWVWLTLIPQAGWIILLFYLLVPTMEKPVKWNHYLSIK